jgi:hypothetical protein
MRTKILVLGLLVLAAGCDSGSKEPVAKVAGAVEERAIPAAIAGIAVPSGVTLSSETSTSKTFNLPSSLSVDDASTWFSGHLPEGRAFDDWSWCAKSQDSLGVSWQWYRTGDIVPDALSVDVGRDDRTGDGYVLMVVRSDYAPQTCDAG